MELTLPEHNLLIGGEPGSGKSVVLSSIVAAGCAGPVDDAHAPRRQAGRARDLATGDGDASSDPDLADATETLEFLQSEMNLRYQRLLDQRRRKLERSGPTGTPARRRRRARALPARRHEGPARPVRRGAARPGLARTCRRRHRRRGDPEAEPRGRPHLRPRPLQLPDGDALHVAGGLRHDPRPGLGDTGLLGVDDRSRASAASATCSPRAGSPSASEPRSSPTRTSPCSHTAQRCCGAVGDAHAQHPRCWPRSSGAGHCTHPVCCSGETVDTETGEILHVDAAHRVQGPPGGDLSELLVPLQDRRLDPDLGGPRRRQGTRPTTSATHPRVFATLTAPSFGAVHRRTTPAGATRTPGAVRASTAWRSRCTAATTMTIPMLGAPLCAECFDYEGAVLWNADGVRALAPHRSSGSARASQRPRG